MSSNKTRIGALNVTTGFPDDFKISDDRVLDKLIARERRFIHVFRIAENSFNRRSYMVEVIRDT